MTLADQIAEGGLPTLLAHQGESVGYAADGGTAAAVTLTAVITPARRRRRDQRYGEESEETYAVIFGTDPTAADGGVADPRRGDRITRGADTLTVSEIDRRGHGYAQVTAVLVRRAAAR